MITSNIDQLDDRMNDMMFSLKGKTAAVLGGAGILGSAISKGLAKAGAKLAIVDISENRAQTLASNIQATNAEAKGYQADAMDSKSLIHVRDNIMRDFGATDILVSAVGGNIPEATVSEQIDFFDISQESLEKVVNLNLFAGAILPAQIFGRIMAENPNGGSIINISSMAALKPLTRVVGYSAAKAAVSNFTQWLAVHLAKQGFTKLRVNAIAPGFFLTEQNRYLLTDSNGELTPRGRAILEHTPMGRFGEPEDLVGTAIWLASDASKFVTGVVVPVDGGFSAFAGV